MKRLILLLFIFVATAAHAQVPVTLNPYQRQQFLDANARPLAGGKLCTFQAGTSTPLATYTDNTGLVQNSNPIVLDSAGEAVLWLTANAYRFILYDSTGNSSCPNSGVQQWTLDFVTPAPFIGGNNNWTGNNTFSGTTTFSGPVNLNAGGSLNGSFSGTPTFTGNLVFSGNPSFTGAPNFLTASPVFSNAIIPNLNASEQSISVLNNASGTTASTLTKLTGAPSTAITTVITDTGGAVGICLNNCTNSGNATIQVNGLVSCIFDGATVAGDFVQISATVAGDCHDVGGGGYPSSGQVVGRVLSTNAGTGTYQMDLFPADIRAPNASTIFPSVIYNTASASTNANIGAVTMVTPGATATYRLSGYISLTTAGVGCTGSTNLLVNLIYQDPVAAGTSTIGTVTGAQPITGMGPGFNGVLGPVFFETVSATNAPGSFFPPFSFRAKIGVPIQYSTTYTIGATCGPGPQYQVFPILEQLTSN